MIDRETELQIITQKEIWQRKRDDFNLSEMRGKTVVVCGGEVFIGNNLDEAVKKARKKLRKEPFCSESSGPTDFPSLYDV